MTEQIPPCGGVAIPVRGGYGPRQILPCECLCEHCVSERLFLATLLSEVRQALGMWRTGYGFDSDAAELLGEVERTMKGGR